MVAEWSVESGVDRLDPYAEIDLSALVRDPQGRERRVPAFWRGGDRWSFRYASPLPGVHTWRTQGSDTADEGLHGRQGEVEVIPYEGDNPIYRHGPLRRSAGHPCLEHEDGTPFQWLGDTWWMGLTRRLTWPDDFRWLTADRARKGFTLVQMVAGLYPDQPPFDPRGENEAGHAWTRGSDDGHALGRPNPGYWDRADERIAHLVSSGLVPCVVGCWGYYLELCGSESIRRHWDYLIARFGALPVVWCLAGEATSRYYTTGADWDSARAEAAEDELRAGWTRLLHHVRQQDPFERPLTIHPTFYGRRMVDEPDLLDVNMLQTGHFGFHTLSTNADMIEEEVRAAPRQPVVMSEACYEGIRATCFADVQRFMYWSSILSGVYGFTYGANGLWQVSTRDDPYGASPHGQSWGRVTWKEAAALPGSAQVGLAARFLSRFRWWEAAAAAGVPGVPPGAGQPHRPVRRGHPGRAVRRLRAVSGRRGDVRRDAATGARPRRRPGRPPRPGGARPRERRLQWPGAGDRPRSLHNVARVLLRSGHRRGGRDRRGGPGRGRRLAVAQPRRSSRTGSWSWHAPVPSFEKSAKGEDGACRRRRRRDNPYPAWSAAGTDAVQAKGGAGPRFRRPWRRNLGARARTGGRRCSRTRPRPAGR